MDDHLFIKSSLCVGESVQVLGTVSRSCLSLIVSVPTCHAVVPCSVPAHDCSVYDMCDVCVKNDQASDQKRARIKCDK